MAKISAEVGKKIKYYRKKRKISVDKLASMIYKGRATVYKYENGSIPIDVDTLDDIATALDIPINYLLDIPNSTKLPPAEMKYPFGQNTVLYLYNYVNQKLIKSRINISYNHERCNIGVTFYYNVASFSSYGDCEYIYHGEMVSFDFVSYFMLVNHMTDAEHINICAFNPWKEEKRTWGLLFGLLNFPLAPAACKVLISTELIEDKDIVLSELILTKDELKKLKNYNMFYLSHAKP